jgi:diaminopimelate decarboxylase
MVPSSCWAKIDAGQWQALAAEHGSPFYLFDADLVAARVQFVKASLAGLAQVYFAVKANPNLALLRAVHDAVDGVDISSGGEQRQAQRAGYAPERMSFAGPAKTDEELHAAINAGVGCISVESMREIEACASIARRLGKPAHILLRVNPMQVHKSYGLKMGGRAVQFGIDEDRLPEAERRVLELAPHLVCRGLHSYVGSQCFDTSGMLDATANALRMAAEHESRTGQPCLKLNLGGGFGVAQSGERKELALASAATELQALLRVFLKERPGCEVFFELGRFITAEAGVYVTRVVDLKSSRGVRYLVCDGGLNHQLAAAGTFGAALRGNFPLFNLSRPDAPLETFNVAGPSCNPTDLLGVQASLPRPQIGDLLGVAMSGSYGLTASPMLFLGRDTPAELVTSQGRFELGRRRHTLEDFN